MKKSLLLSLCLVAGFWLKAQTLTLHQMVQFPFVTNSLGQVGSSDCWGWTDSTGVDYAIMGNSDHVAFVRASDGAVLDTIQLSKLGDGYYHRDFKSYGHYCYAVCEMSGKREGLAVIDMQYLPDSVHFVTAYDANNTLIRSHNLSIDVNTGFAYLEGDEFIGSNGVEIIDLADPENPVKVGFLSVQNTHDIYARNDTVWVAEGYTPAYSVWDLTNKSNPVLLGRVTQPSFGYCHQIWPSDDGKFFYTTEETANKTVKVWDANDMSGIFMRGQYIAANQLAHNTHVMGHYMFISHYTSGVTVVDIADPDNPVEVAAYDTYPTNNVSDFYGCWGAFPFTASNYVYASNFEGKLFILDWDEQGVVALQEGSRPQLGKCWPNPVAAFTNVSLHLQGSERVQLNLIDMQGKVVAKVFEGMLDAGNQTISWQRPGGLAAGTYFMQVLAGESSRTEKLILN